MLTADQLEKIAPYSTDALRAAYLPHLNAALAKYQINTPARLAAFLAQIIHESSSFRHVKELADGRAYEGNKSLGNHSKGDGERYKGRGLIQVTGRANYSQCGTALGLDLISHPEQLEQPENAVDSAAWYWNTHNCNALADVGKFNQITRIINGGYNGLNNRLAIYNHAKTVLGLA